MRSHAGARERPGVRRLLDAARIAVDMDASLVSLHEDGAEVVLACSSRTGLARDVVGRRTPLPETYCGQVAAGRLAPWVPDARADPVAASLAVTRSRGIGSYVGAPLRGGHGEVVGMLCCISRAPDDRLGPTAVAVLETLALALSAELDLDAAPAPGTPAPDEASAPRRPPVSVVDHHRGVLALARGEGLRVEFEPLVDLARGRVRAFVPRCRTEDPALGPSEDAVAAAGRHGLALEVERACLSAVLAHQGQQPRGAALAVGVSAQLLRRPGVVEDLVDHVPGGLWVAVDPGGASADARLHEAARRLRTAGAVLAVDGTGSPSASLVDALRLQPHLVSVTAAVLDGLAGASLRPHLVASLLAVTRSVGARLVARDVATPAQRAQLRDLGVPLGRGPAVGPVGPLPPGDPPGSGTSR